jgi:hypothetical protein
MNLNQLSKIMKLWRLKVGCTYNCLFLVGFMGVDAAFW